jgi:excisionase family DNA binding protein
MNSIASMTAEQLLIHLERLPSAERQKFFTLLSERAFRDRDNLSYEELFGHLKDEEFTAQEAAEYLEVSIATFRRYVRDKKITASSEVGNTHLYSLASLREFKKAKKMTKTGK